MSGIAIVAILLGLVFVLPLVVAVVLFKLLPSSADVEGPFKGMKIKLGGAFGGYFIILIVGLTFIANNRNLIERGQSWNITGVIMLDSTDTHPPLANLENEIQWNFQPPSTMMNSGRDRGQFTIGNLNLFRVPQDLPYVRVSHPDYYPVPVQLSDTSAIEIDRDNHVIRLKNPIILIRNHEKDSYEASGGDVVVPTAGP